ncbi:MAG: hypothetical protein IIY21_18310 [Clostridiales bacterium]|nr:hypothetical protein [Clostridiales bacterium]
MEIKQYITMAVGLIVGVLLISGAVAPVIANVSGNSGSGESSAVSYKEYTNTGDVYLAEPDGISHEITVTYTGSKMVFAFDGTNFLERSLGTEDWDVPIAQYKVTNSPYYPQYRIFSLQWSAHMESLIFNGDTFSLNEITGEDGLCLSIVTNYNNYRDVIFITKYWTGGTESYTVTMYIAQEGEYVYAKSPTVYADTTVSVSSLKYAITTISGMTGNLYADAGGWAKLSKWQGALNEHYPHAYCEMDFSAEVGSSYYDYYLDSFTVTVHTHDSEGAYVLDDVTFNVSMSGVNGEISYDYAVDMFIVPAVEKYVPQNGLWSMADNGEHDIYTKYIGQNLYGVYSDNPSDGATPFYMDDMSDYPFVLPILIGETFYAMIELIMMPYDWNAWVTVYGVGDYGMVDTNHLHISGDTLTFTDNSNVEYTLDGVIAYISPTGEYTAYTEGTLSSVDYLAGYHMYDGGIREVSGSNVYYKFVADNKEIIWGSGEYENATNGGEGWDVQSDTYSENEMDIEYITDNGRISGFKVAVDDDGFTDTANLNLGIYRFDLAEDESYEGDEVERVTDVFFAVAPLSAGGSGGGGGGSSVSDTLRVTLSVVPLIMTVGLVLGTIAYLRIRN